MSAYRLLAYIPQACADLFRRRVRSALTILGVAIGAGSIIAALGIGTMVNNAISVSFHALDRAEMFVNVDADQNDPDAARLRYKDAVAIAKENTGTIRDAFPVLRRVYRIRNKNIDTVGMVVSGDGASDDALPFLGRPLDKDDIASGRRVCILSIALKKRLFESDNPIGSLIRINGKRFAIVGVREKERIDLFNGSKPPEYAEIPFSTFHVMTRGSIDALRVLPHPGISPARLRASIASSLRRLHGKDAAYTIEDTHVFISRIRQALRAVTGALAAIDAVSLLVAGIGVMNVMLASLHERVREIGVRKTLGASASDIFAQFLIESLLLSIIGCACGAFIGIAATTYAWGLIAKTLSPTPIPLGLIVTLAATFSLLVGVVFGVYPAARARALQPLQALRA
jgi:putative ABC transport system permease protein